MINQEKEYKYQFEEKDFKKIECFLKNNAIQVKKKLHVNYYIDTHNHFLRKLDITLRIREYENNTYELTMKQKKEKLGNLHIKNEVNEYIDVDEIEDILKANRINAYIYKKITMMFVNLKLINETPKIQDFVILGALTTERQSFKVSQIQDLIIMDKSYYLDNKDYELEIETNDFSKVRYFLTNLFNNLNVIPLNDNFSKNRRFLNRYLALKGGE